MEFTLISIFVSAILRKEYIQSFYSIRIFIEIFSYIKKLMYYITV